MAFIVPFCSFAEEELFLSHSERHLVECFAPYFRPVVRLAEKNWRLGWSILKSEQLTASLQISMTHDNKSKPPLLGKLPFSN